MDVASYIREYLFKQDFLDIPGLGTFFLTKEPFSIQVSDQVIRPGSKNLIFRENSGISNDTLSYFIARRAGISVDEAREMVRGFVSPVRQLFLSRGNIEIAGLGQFSVPDGFHLDFRPYPFNFSPSSFGLGSVSLSQFDEETADIPVDLEAPVSQTAYQAPHETAPHETAVHETAPHETAVHETNANETASQEIGAHETDVIQTAPAVPYYNEPLDPDHNYPEPVTSTEEPAVTPREPAFSHEEPVEANTRSDEHLPTAAEIYRMYGFKKEDEENSIPAEDSPAQTDESLLSGSTFSEFPVYTGGNEPALTYPNTLAFSEEPVDFIQQLQTPPEEGAKHSPATDAEADSPKKDLIYNPLAYDTDLPVHAAVREPEHNIQTGDLGPAQELPASGYEFADNIKPEYGNENSSVYWILGSILLLCLLAGFAYVERAPLSQALSRAGIYGQPDNDKKELLKTDSTLTSTAPVPDAGTKATDSANLAHEAGTKNAEKSGTAGSTAVTSQVVKPADSTLAKPAPVSSAVSDTSMINISQASQFMLVDASVHLLQTAKKRQKQLSAAGKPAHIIEMGEGVLMRYKISLGDYSDKAAAKEALTAAKASGNKGVQIFENKSKKN